MACLTLFLLCLISLLLGKISSIPRNDFYQFGENIDEILSPADDLSSVEIQLRVPIIFYGREYSGIYVNINGLLSFGTEVPNFHNSQLPLSVPAIAAFYADIDTRGRGNVYYRETDNPELLHRAKQDILSYFTGMRQFKPKTLFIATWSQVGYFQSRTDKVNTFQVVIATDGKTSFVFLYYLEDGIQWISGEGKNRNQADALAQIGFMSEDNSFTVQGSGSQHVFNIDKYSNIDIPGAFLFLIGIEGQEGVFRPADFVTRDVVVQTLESTGIETCSTNARLCHSYARCVDYHPGSCCECLSPYYGNGKSCIQIAKPQRVNGRVTGILNGVEISNVDLHSYIVTGEGRTYTAVSQIPIHIGFAMQTLNVIGGILGWLFALPSQRAQNGFMITGGVFNHTAVIQFLSPESKVVIRQHFTGQDLFDYLHMTAEISGTAPEIPRGKKVIIDDYSEEYARVAPGVIKSFTSHVYSIDGTNSQFTVDQTFNYEECNYGNQFSEGDTFTLNVARNFIVYDENEKIVRYTMTNKVGLRTTGNPCVEASVNCEANSHCVPDGDSYRCICDLGYEHWYQENTSPTICIDVNECLQSSVACDSNAECHNTQGSFRCQCKPGYNGDGHSCRRPQTCDLLTCHPNAECRINTQVNEPECQCNIGYHGDGFNCQLQSGVSCGDDVCDINADCSYVASPERYQCQCKSGFQGDGHYCFENKGVVQCNVADDCHPQAQCIYDTNYHNYHCKCNAGFEGNGRVCQQEEVSCNVDNICSQYASCVYHSESQKYKCQCKSGYRGDGLNCFHSVADECGGINTCHASAECLFDETTQRYYCQCRQGYHGDGRTYCELEENNCDVVNNCHPEAECIFDIALLQHRCRCRPSFVGDGSFCRHEESCFDNPILCHDHAVCTRIQGSELYRCQCKPGFEGDGSNCHAISFESGQAILFNQGMTIMEMPIVSDENNPGRQLLMIPGQLAVAIEVDCYDKYFYWSDVSQRTINKAKLDGSDDELIIETDLGSPEGIAIDWVSRNIYWTDSALDHIEVAKLDSPYRKVLIKDNLVNPRGIAVHPKRGKLYWADWNRNEPKIESSNLDGSERNIFVAENINLPNALTIDYENEELCWADAGTHKLECVGLDGKNRRVVYDGISYPFGLTNYRDRFYWSDWDMKAILSIHKSGSTVHTEHNIPLGGGGRLYGIVAVKDYCPRLVNACLRGKDVCPYLCLPRPNGSKTCACPDNLEEGQTCEESQ